MPTNDLSIRSLSDGQRSDYETLDGYLRDIRAKYPRTGRRETRDLMRKYHLGCERAWRNALAQIVYGNIGLVIAIAMQYRVPKHQLVDLIQEGVIGMMRGVRTYDPTRAEFVTYVTYWVRHAIQQHIASQAYTINRPISVQQLARRVRQLEERFRNRYGITIDDDRLAILASVTGTPRDRARRISDVRSLSNQPVSLTEEQGDADYDRKRIGIQLSVPAPDMVETISRTQIRRVIQQELDRMAPALGTHAARDLAIFRTRYELNDDVADQPALTLQELAEKTKTSRQRIHQIVNRISRMLVRRLLRRGDIELPVCQPPTAAPEAP